MRISEPKKIRVQSRKKHKEKMEKLNKEKKIKDVQQNLNFENGRT